ncbi:hypothetical protein GCM10007923_08550 [Shinella yambaruensis]|uniref:Uncharacterized protein n=1 Tax=Shinella yambaruensis TaxID=415996 RepID=A0ABQ5ZCA6_9HYPH|nr:hypothetical protein GCM10007923_08550 [Shinella yambaruensis]
MRLQFLQGPLPDLEVLDVVSCRIPTVAFSYVGCHRRCRTAYLRDKAIDFVAREPPRQVVAFDSQIHGALPDLQILIGINRRPLAPSYCLLATA